MITLTLEQAVRPAPLREPSEHVLEVASMFGLGVDRERALTLVPRTDLTLRAHQLVFVTGPSGGGKSTLLRLIDEALRERADAKAVRFEALPAPPEAPLVDGFGEPELARVLRWLSLAGLNDAFVMLRSPAELSDGQRYRLRLAHAMAAVERQTGGGLPVVLADEFGATLDRLTAATVAQQVRKWADRTPACFVAATTHDDLLEPMSPDVLIEKGLGGEVQVLAREA